MLSNQTENKGIFPDLPLVTAEIVVVTATFPATSLNCPATDKVLPQLNPYHPNQRINTPIV